MQEQRVKVNQIELQIREYPGEGDALLFLHFSGANLMMWQPVIPYFQDRYRIILIDLKGHGKSDRPETGYHMDQMAGEVIGVLDHLRIEGVHIIGSSLGAEVGLSLAVNNPDRMLSLVCDGALASEYGPYGTWEGSQRKYQERVAGQLEKMRSAPEPIYPSVDALVDDRRQVFEKYGWWNPHLEMVVRYGVYKVDDGKYVKSFGKKANINYMGHYFSYRFEEYYPNVKCPLLMLAEKDLDDAREKAAMIGLKNLAERAEIAEIDGWAHPYCWLLKPEDAVKPILKFLEESVR